MSKLNEKDREFIRTQVSERKVHPYDLWEEYYKDKVRYSTIRSILSDAGISFQGFKRKIQKEVQEKEAFEISKTSKGLTAEVRIKTEKGEEISFQDLLENPKFKRVIDAGGIDLVNYYVDRFVTNSWDVTNKNGQTYTNHQFKIWWRLRVPEPLEIAIKNIEKNIANLKRPTSKLPTTRVLGSRMIEVALYDVHFASLAWAEETGEDYDLTIGRKVYANAIDQLLHRVEGMDIDYFLFPIGNDFFHVNDFTNQTPTNRNLLDVDSRLAKIIEQGQYMLIDSIERLKVVAPVKLFWIPGNHDPQTSFYLLRILDAWYKEDTRVEVDTSPKIRKYKVYGKNLIGFLHGCELVRAKHYQLPGLMADEASDLWKPNQYREIHMGHTHSKNEMIFNSASAYGSVVVRVIPSIAGTDAWHFAKGYVKTTKTAQFFVWRKNYGLESVQDIHIPSNLYKDYTRKKYDSNKRR